MITCKEDYIYYLEADRIALSKPRIASLSFSEKLNIFFFKDYIWEFQKELRMLEFLKNKQKSMFGYLNYIWVYYRYRKLSYKLGFTIPPNVFGPGLSIAHYGNIVVNPNAKVGSNCRIHSGVNIGTMAGYADKAPVLGDNIYLAPGAKLFGDITIASNTIIGANAVINKSYGNEKVALGGIPASIISESVDIDNVLIRATNIIKLGLNKNDNLYKLTSLEIKKLLDEKSG